MADIDYYEVFGVEAPTEEPEGGKEASVAETPTDTDKEGAKEHEDAERAVEGEEAPEEAGEKEEKQSDEENAQYAKIRREAEAHAREKLTRERDGEIAALGLTDDRGRPIVTYEQFVAYNKGRGERRAAEEHRAEVERYIDMGLSDEEALEVAEAKAAAKRTRELEARLRAIEERERQAAFNAKVKEELELIAEYDPTIKSVDDLTKMENFSEFAQFVEEGDNYITAYLRSHRGARPYAAEPPQTTQGDKSHLRATQTRGGGGIDVPESVIAEYRVFNPDATRAEITAHYKKTVKKS